MSNLNEMSEDAKNKAKELYSGPHCQDSNVLNLR